MADVEYSVQHEWGMGKHLQCVPPDRMRLVWERG